MFQTILKVPAYYVEALFTYCSKSVIITSTNTQHRDDVMIVKADPTSCNPNDMQMVGLLQLVDVVHTNDLTDEQLDKSFIPIIDREQIKQESDLFAATFNNARKLVEMPITLPNDYTDFMQFDVDEGSIIEYPRYIYLDVIPQ